MSSESALTKILLVVGTRPEVIKMAPVYFELTLQPKFEVLLCASGQHSDLLKLALEDFELSPDYQLELMQHGQSLGSLTSRAITGLERILEEVKPNVVLVHGDTTTTFAAALAAFYAQIPVGHVEAGLRTKDIHSPFPEELNRQAVSRIARWNFAPTAGAKQNLLDEGIDDSRITITGNTIVDSLRILSEDSVGGKLDKHRIELVNLLGFDPRAEKTVLVTTHRRENLGEGIENIFRAVGNLARADKDSRFVLPLHPNPQVRIAASELSFLDNVSIIEPLGYKHFMLLLSSCHFVITDSGGVQEEAVTLGKKVLVARDTSERREGMVGGQIRLIGASTDRLTQAGMQELSKPPRESKFELVSEVFGNGRASSIIQSTLERDLALFGRE
jgi:UDP-N-acetylglucosamine 2-epimerase (non-hydrolysing)